MLGIPWMFEKFHPLWTLLASVGLLIVFSAGCDEAAGESDAAGETPAGMVWVPGGEFTMGSNRAYPEEAPAHRVSVDGFWMSEHPVTNAQFAEFVEDTGYVTVAERELDPTEFPELPADMLAPGSMVFVPPVEADLEGHLEQWWQWVPGARWDQPEGPGSSIDDRMDHPVVHVAYEDALAYARWAGGTLPTEAQWERAARGGLDAKRFVWGDEFKPEGQYMANTWQGRFPVENTGEDGFLGTSPVRSFPPNDFGLYDMAGNVWEWTRNWFDFDSYTQARGKHNPQGPPEEAAWHPSGELHRVMRGGSFLCADNYCLRYRPSARSSTTPDSVTSHLGFRIIIEADAE